MFSEYQKDPQDFLERYKNLPDYVKYVQQIIPKLLSASNRELIPCYPWKIEETKWDGFEIGGHAKNLLLLKNGRRASAAQICNIDWEGMRKEAEPDICQFERYDESYQKLYRGEGNYLKTGSSFITWQVLDELGRHEAVPEYEDIPAEIGVPWRRGWFDRFIRPANPKNVFYLVDYHS